MTESDVMLSWLHVRPDGEVVRSAPRRHAAVGAAFQYLQLLADHDPVELRDRTAGMEAAAACGEAMMVGEVAQASSVRAPFVAVAHQHRRRSEEHTSALQSLMRISYAVF